MKQTHFLKILALLFIPLITSACAGQAVKAAASAGVEKKYCVNLDYSSVPKLVNKRFVTLKVNVGACSSVSVEANGVTIAAKYIPEKGEAIFTTGAKNITITAINLTSSGTGKVEKAYLLDDRRWAYSQTFDDQYLDVWENAKPLLDEKGWKAGIAVVASFASAAWGPCMSWEQMEALQKSGWDIFNHTYSHPHLTCDDFLQEFAKNNKEMQPHFPGYNITQMVYPFEDVGFLNCKKFPPPGFLSAQKGNSSGVTYVDSPITDRFMINRSGQYGTDNSRWKEEADTVASQTYPGWIIQITHHVYPGNTPGADPVYSTTRDCLKDFYDYLDSKYGSKGNNSMWFAPAAEVMDYLLTRDNVKVSAKQIIN